MRPRLMQFLALAMGIVAALEVTASSQNPQHDDAVPPTAESLLRTAFANRYEVDLTSKIELLMKDGSGQQRRRRFRAASKVIDDRVHSVVSPEKPPSNELIAAANRATAETAAKAFDAALAKLEEK